MSREPLLFPQLRKRLKERREERRGKGQEFTFLFDEGMPHECRITVTAVNELQAAIKAREKFTEKFGTYHISTKLISKEPKLISKEPSIAEEEYLKVAKLEKQLAQMQHDTTLTWAQRKTANDLLKKIITRPDYPSVPKQVLEEAIKKVKETKEYGRNPTEFESRGIIDLVRSQFNFTCPVCEEIAAKVSADFPDRKTQTEIYEAVYKLSSTDRKAQDEATITLEKLGIWETVAKEVQQGWENLKGENQTKI